SGKLQFMGSSFFLSKDGTNFVFVNESKTWTEAQSYCREHYTDLASVRNQTENEQITGGRDLWIGLYRDSWKWSDGSAHSFSNWNTDTNQPNGGLLEPCVTSYSGKWEEWPCSTRWFFVCYDGELRSTIVFINSIYTKKCINSIFIL
uniref:C-type lectin domain-containing protein n=1 Tax=Dicentrarchus labrax TaxID=13489 RepID=A0A8C4GGP2_DICLA